MPAPRLLAILALAYVIIFLVCRPYSFTFFTGWTLVLFGLYLVAWLIGYVTSVITSTMLVLAIFILLGFAVLYFSSSTANEAGIAEVALLWFTHVMPMLVLLILNGWPTAAPSWWFVIGLGVVYVIFSYVVLGSSVSSHYLTSLSPGVTLIVLVGLGLIALVGVTLSTPCGQQ